MKWKEYFFSPPARWGLLDFKRWRPPSSFLFPSFSRLLAISWSQWASQDHTCQHLPSPDRSGFARPHLPALDRSGPCRTQTASARSLWASTDGSLSAVGQIEYMPNRMPDRMSDRMPDRMSDRVPERTSDRMPDTMAEYMSDRMPDRMSEHMSGRLPDRMRDHSSDRMPEYMPDRMSEYKSDQFAEYIEYIEYMFKYTSWNVMVGTTRSKVIYNTMGIFSNIRYFIYFKVTANWSG